ncbi:DUF4055 domain-containing protein [Immundisolibacter sp.]
MPIDTRHPQYVAAANVWRKCRDAIAGEEAVKAGGERYLPKLGGQDDKDYAAYLMRAYYYNASGRTHEGMVGTIFRIDPTVEPTPPSGRIHVVAQRAVSEVLAVGRCGILVDAPPAGGAPYASIYQAEDVVNWLSVKAGGREILRRVVLREITQQPSESDVYELDNIVHYRELYLDPESGVYMQQLWTQDAKGNWEHASDPITPLAAGQPMVEIPFVFVSASGVDAAVLDPPLLDLVNVNLSHYRSAADLEHGRHYTALPTAWVAGFDAEKELSIGAGTAWVTDNVNAKAGFLEFTGQGLGALEHALEAKERQMALLGAQLFTTPGQAETATAARIRRSQQTASLASIADAVSDAMTAVYAFLQTMDRADASGVSYVLSKDFLPETMDAPLITSLVATYQSGALSLESLLWNFKQGELLPPDVTPEDEAALITAGIERVTMATGGL